MSGPRVEQHPDETDSEFEHRKRVKQTLDRQGAVVSTAMFRWLQTGDPTYREKALASDKGDEG